MKNKESAKGSEEKILTVALCGSQTSGVFHFGDQWFNMQCSETIEKKHGSGSLTIQGKRYNIKFCTIEPTNAEDDFKEDELEQYNEMLSSSDALLFCFHLANQNSFHQAQKAYQLIVKYINNNNNDNNNNNNKEKKKESISLGHSNNQQTKCDSPANHHRHRRSSSFAKLFTNIFTSNNTEDPISSMIPPSNTSSPLSSSKTTSSSNPDSSSSSKSSSSPLSLSSSSSSKVPSIHVPIPPLLSNRIKKEEQIQLPIMLLGLKDHDSNDSNKFKPEISTIQALKVADEMKCQYFEGNIKTGHNLEFIISDLAKQIIEYKRRKMLDEVQKEVDQWKKKSPRSVTDWRIKKNSSMFSSVFNSEIEFLDENSQFLDGVNEKLKDK